MSYILDALKKAQAERDLGQVPAAQAALRGGTVGDAPAASPATGRAMRVAPLAAGAVALLAAAALAWAWWGRTTPTTGARPAPGLTRDARPAPPLQRDATAPAERLAGGAPSDAAAVPAGRPDAGPPVQPPGAAAAPSPATQTPTSPVTPSAPASPPVLPPVLPPPPAAVAAAPAAGPAVSPTAPIAPAPDAPAAPKSPAPRADPAITPIDSLDAATRARLPRLAAGGAIHSAERRQRMVILDGQVLREGDSVVPGVLVQAIEPQGVLLLLDERYGNRRVRLNP